MAFPNPPKTWAFQESVESSELNAELRDALTVATHLLGRKSADQIVNNSSTLVNVTDLSFTVAVNEIWHVQAWLLCDSNGTADIKFGWTLPASATIFWGPIAGGDGTNIEAWHSTAISTSPVGLVTTANDTYGSPASATIFGVALSGIVAVAGTAGTVQLQYAQNTPTVVDTKIKINSCLLGTRIA